MRGDIGKLASSPGWMSEMLQAQGPVMREGFNKVRSHHRGGCSWTVLGTRGRSMSAEEKG
jgi:hypothetical protein